MKDKYCLLKIKNRHKKNPKKSDGTVFFFKEIYESIVDLQCCVNFYCKAK